MEQVREYTLRHMARGTFWGLEKNHFLLSRGRTAQEPGLRNLYAADQGIEVVLTQVWEFLRGSGERIICIGWKREELILFTEVSDTLLDDRASKHDDISPKEAASIASTIFKRIDQRVPRADGEALDRAGDDGEEPWDDPPDAPALG